MIEDKSVFRCDPRKRKFSPTSLEVYMRCKRKYYFAKVLRLTPKGVNVPAEFGSAIHVGVGTFYAVREMSADKALAKFDPSFTSNKTLSRHELAKILAIKAFTTSWLEEVKQGDEKHSILAGTILLDKYCECYKNDMSKFDANLIECAQWIEMPNNTMLGLILDRVRIEGKYVTIVDTKTSSRSLTDYFFRRFRNSFQMSAGYYAVQQIMKYCDSIQIDGIKVPYSEKDGFVRQIFDRSELQMADWLNTYLNCTNQIIENLEKDEKGRLESFYQCPTACDDYSGCPYLSLCMYGLNHPAVKEGFIMEGGEK